MTTTVKLRKLLHRKAWESCTSAPTSTTSGGFTVSDKYDLNNGSRAFMMTSASAVYMYEGNEDAWLALPVSGATGTFAAGSCGEYRSLGAMGGVFTQVAAAGTTTKITTASSITRSLAGCRLRVVAGSGVGYEGVVESNTLGGGAVLTVAPANDAPFDATTQFQVYSGSLWFFNAGTTAVGFRVYDVATNTWTARSVTGIPTAWGTIGQLVSTMGSAKSFAVGTASAGAASTLTNASKAWTANMWTNYQLRITGGTGKGQIRAVTSNTSTVLTTATAWTVVPDATSIYSLEGNDDVFFLMGNNSATAYRFSVAANAWTTLAPTAARAGGMSNGATADWVDNAGGWDNEVAIPHYTTWLNKQNGRYIYSFRGAGQSTLDVYDIVANTWISAIAYGNQSETFNTGSHSIDLDGFIYVVKESTGRVFKFEVDKNRLLPLATNTTQAALGGTVVEGDKMFILPYSDGGTTILFAYFLRHSGSEMVRMLLI